MRNKRNDSSTTKLLLKTGKVMMSNKIILWIPNYYLRFK